MTNSTPLFQIRQCTDGSSTIYSEQFQQCFHNPNGALTESLYVFFEMGQVFEQIRARGDISILEIGFGSGLNAWILAEFLDSKVKDGNARFYSVEAYPLDVDTALACGYSKIIRYPNLPGITRNLFEAISDPGSHSVELSPRFSIHIFSGKFADMPSPPEAVNVIFFDAFSPEKNPELWTTDVFKKLALWSNSETLLTTYCASSAARASMAEAGWFLSKVPGILGKREITLAALSEKRLEGIGKRLDEKKLIERRKNGDL